MSEMDDAALLGLARRGDETAFSQLFARHQRQLFRYATYMGGLARFGLMSADGIDRTSGTVLADVLVGDDGLARAVRFVQKRSQEQRQ